MLSLMLGATAPISLQNACLLPVARNTRITLAEVAGMGPLSRK